MIDVYTLDVNDSVAMTVEFENGALGVVHMSRFATGKANDLDLTDPRRPGGAEDLGEHHRLDPRDLPRPRHRHPDLDPLRAARRRPRNEERFLIALLSGVNGEPDFRHATRVQKLLDLAFVSDAEGRMLAVD